MKLQDFDIYEIHEAFAAQVLCTLKAWESDNYCRNRLGRSEPERRDTLDSLNTEPFALYDHGRDSTGIAGTMDALERA